MKKIENKAFDEERALYNSDSIEVVNCKFYGPKDGESALKESKNIITRNCYFNLRYPFWHDENISIINCKQTENCHAALWYSKNINVKDYKLHGIKVFRECQNICIDKTDIISPEGFWNCKNIDIKNQVLIACIS